MGLLTEKDAYYERNPIGELLYKSMELLSESGPGDMTTPSL